MSVSVGFIGRGSFYKELKNHIRQNGGQAFNFTYSPDSALSADILVNYGLYGNKLEMWDVLHPSQEFGAILNPKLFGNKFECLHKMNDVSVPVPLSCRRITQSQATESNEEADWIAKPYWSFGGRDIFPIQRTSDVHWDTHYAQQRILNRRYELRVHVFGWIPKDQWLVSKRTHPDGERQLTWNHHQGGSFSNINLDESNTGVFKRAKDYAEKAAKALGYDFCSVDFIVQNSSAGGPLPLFFIEANTATGFSTDRTREVYLDAFLKLANFPSVADLSRTLGRTVVQTPPLPPPVRTEEIRTPQMRHIPLTTEQRLTIITHLTRTGITAQDMIHVINTLT